MHKFLMVIICLFGFSAFGATDVVVKTTGMTCNACVDKMKAEVAKISSELKGVSVEVKFNQAIVKVTDESMTPDAVAAVVKKVEAAAIKSGLKVVQPATGSGKSA